MIDEVQRRPDLFPVLRVLGDRRPLPARFLVLGSASPDLLRQSAESLTGRLEVVRLSGFSLGEVGAGSLGRLWLRGGFPPSYLARSAQDSLTWRLELVRTFFEQLVVLYPGGTSYPLGDRVAVRPLETVTEGAAGLFPRRRPSRRR